MTKLSYILQREQQLPTMPFWDFLPLVRWSGRTGLRQIQNGRSCGYLYYKYPNESVGVWCFPKDSSSIQMSMWKFLSLPAFMRITAPYMLHMMMKKIRVRFLFYLFFFLSLSWLLDCFLCLTALIIEMFQHFLKSLRYKLIKLFSATNWTLIWKVYIFLML